MKAWQIVLVVVGILVVIPAILSFFGALGYFGVLSPGELLPERCISDPVFACDEYEITSSGISFGLINELDSSISFEDVSASSDGVSFEECAYPEFLAGGEFGVFSCSLASGEFDGHTRVVVDIEYLSDGRAFAQSATVELFRRAG